MALPDFFIIGAPKAGTSALHDALAAHPQLYLSPVKEPKFFLTDGRPQPRTKGPGDAHGRKETIWRQDHYEALFDDAPYGVLRGESSAFYLHDFAAHTRIRHLVPRARLIAILRDPVDRAYSNWLHLWADGLEPIGDFVRAFEAETERVDAGWGFFWEYRGLGLYGRQLQHLFQVFPRNQVLLLRYRELIDHPNATLQRIHLFLGVTPDPVVSIPQQNSRSYSPPSARHAALGALVRSGARVGAHLPPSWWRKGSTPVLRLLQHDAQRRPALSSEHREYLIRAFADDIALLEAVTSASYSDWLQPIDRGDFATRTRERADIVSVS